MERIGVKLANLDGLSTAKSVEMQGCSGFFRDDYLQDKEGIKGKWFVIALTEDEMQNVLTTAGAATGDEVKIGQYSFIYNPSNIFRMDLLISAEPYDPGHQITYTGIAKMIDLRSRTAIQGPRPGDGQEIYYYQPFDKKWLDHEEEISRREKEAAEEAAENAD